MTQKYQLTFSGIILPSFDHDQTKEYTQKLLKLSSDQIEGFFSGKTVVIKKNLPLDEAQKIKSALESKGLMINIAEDKVELSLAGGIAPVAAEMSPRTQTSRLHASNNNAQNVNSSEESFSYYASPSASLSSGRSNEEDEIPQFFKFSVTGRLGRLSYLNMMWSMYGVAVLIGLFAGLAMANYPTLGMGIMYVILMPFVGYFSVRMTALRLHDLNKSAWYSFFLLIGLVPYVGGILSLGFSLYLMCVKGTEGENDFGNQPKQGAIVGLVLTIVIPLIIILLIVFYASAFLAILSSLI